LCAHNGYGFDFPILLSNMERCGMKEHVLKKINLHFADTFQFCKELQEDHLIKELQETKLSMDSLFSKFCPGKQFLNRHRAMGDVNAMVEIFSKEPFKTAFNNIDYATSESLCEWFTIQYNEKEQRILLEEKMAKLDAYTRNVYSKKLFQLQLTYDGLQAIFENCCSYMDFYEVLQDRGIDRKTAKHFACQFGSMGLRNQGTEPYCNLPKSAVTGGEELDYSLDNVDLLLTKEETERPPNVPPVPSVDDGMMCESTECWDDELDESRSFTFTIPKHVVPLSLTIDDFVSNSPSKQSKTSKQKGKNSYSSKQNSKNLQHQNSKPVHEIENVNNGNKLGDLAETKSTAKSNTRPNVSRKKPDPADVFRNGASSLQVGKFPDKKERYELEKEVLNQIGKVNEENNSEEDGIRKQSNYVKETSVEDIPKTSEIFGAESTTPTNSELLRNEGKSTAKETSQKDGMNNKKFPRKFVRKTMKKSRNNKNSYAHKQSSSGSVQGNTAVVTMKRNNNKQSEESCEHEMTADEEPGVVPLHEKYALKESDVKTSQENSNGQLSGSLGVSASGNGENFASVARNDVISKTAQIDASKNPVGNRPTSKRQHRKQDVVKDNSSGLKKEISSNNVTTRESLVSQRNQPVADEEFKSSNGGKLPFNTPKDVLKENLNENKSMSNSESRKTSLKRNQASTYQSNYDLNNSRLVSQQQTAETNGVASELVQSELSELDGKKDQRNDKLVLKRDKQVPRRSREIRERNKEFAVLQGDKQKNTEKENICHQDTTVLEGDTGIMKKTEVIHEGNVGQKEATILVRNKKDQKKKTKLKRKQNRQPVVFVNRKSIEEKQKNWPRVEIFVGDFPIHVPVEPSAVCQLQDSRAEEESDLNAESKEKGKDSCGELETQPGKSEQVLDNVRSDEGMKSSHVQVTNDDSSIENSNQDQSTLEQCDGEAERKEGAESIVTSELHDGLIPEDSNVGSMVQSSNSVATSSKLECRTSSIDQVSNIQLLHTSDEIPVSTAVKTTDSSQQTELDIDWYKGKERKKLVDQEQQTDCALLSTFNIETSLSLVHMQDKETLTDHPASRRAQSTDTISSYGDNLSDSYGTSPCSPLYDTDSQYDINTEVFNRREYESPAGVFDISMSPHHDDRYLKKDSPYPERDTQYPEENTRHPETRYLEEDTWYPEDVTRYEIPSPEGNYEYDGFFYARKYQRMPRADLDCNISSNSNIMRQRFPTHPCPPVPSPIYPANPNHIPAAPLFHHRFPQQYFQRLPGNTSNFLPHQYHGSFKF
ncbi:uncharacterized protein LOC113677423 isoform X2, partial [Paramuricea clavata]